MLRDLNGKSNIIQQLVISLLGISQYGGIQTSLIKMKKMVGELTL